MSHSLDFYFPRELKKRCYVLYFMFLFSYTSHCLYFIYLEWFETISESSIFLFFRFICFLLMHLSRPCIPGAQAPILFYFRGSTRPQCFLYYCIQSSQAPLYTIVFLISRPLYLLYHFILGSQAPMPPIPFYSRFPGPYTSYIIVFIGAKAPMPHIPFYSWFPGSYTSYIFVF